MGRHLRTDDTFEVEVTLAGTHRPYVPATGPSYACGGTPSEPEGVDDVEVLGMFGLKLVPVPLAERGSHPRGTWQRFDLLTGLDDASRAQILQNVLNFIGEREATYTLLSSLPDEEDA